MCPADKARNLKTTKYLHMKGVLNSVNMQMLMRGGMSESASGREKIASLTHGAQSVSW